MFYFAWKMLVKLVVDSCDVHNSHFPFRWMLFLSIFSRSSLSAEIQNSLVRSFLESMFHCLLFVSTVVQMFYSLVPFSRRIAFIKHVRALWRIHRNEIRRSTNEIKWNHVHACASRYDNVNLVNAFWLSFIHSFIHHTSGPEYYRKRIIGTRYVDGKW